MKSFNVLIAGAEVDGCGCAREVTPRGLQVSEVVSRSDPYLRVASGFEGFGSRDAFRAARPLIDRMLGRASAIDIAPDPPQRFARPEALHA